MLIAVHRKSGDYLHIDGPMKDMRKHVGTDRDFRGCVEVDMNGVAVGWPVTPGILLLPDSSAAGQHRHKPHGASLADSYPSYPMSTILAAIVFSVLVVIVALFQLALAVGMPWGRLAWGGRFPGTLPPRMRIASVVSALLLLAFGLIVCARASLLLPGVAQPPAVAIWVVVGYSALGTVVNAATPSKWERIAWTPVAVLMLLTSLAVALS